MFHSHSLIVGQDSTTCDALYLWHSFLPPPERCQLQHPHRPTLVDSTHLDLPQELKQILRLIALRALPPNASCTPRCSTPRSVLSLLIHSCPGDYVGKKRQLKRRRYRGQTRVADRLVHVRINLVCSCARSAQGEDAERDAHLVLALVPSWPARWVRGHWRCSEGGCTLSLYRLTAVRLSSSSRKGEGRRRSGG